jgi:adenine-specific DNA-methyltransferase
VYSGLYIYSDTFNVNEIEDLLKTNDFVEYVKSLKKYKNGGYYTFNSKDLENYLNYKINYVENKSC